jgi:hypothetical protein
MFLFDNPSANGIRRQLIKNVMKLNECDIGRLSEVFFSNENIEIINRMIILSVFRRTKIKIKNQSVESLIIVMKYVFESYARHLPYNIKKQIMELNKIVLCETLPLILTEVTQRYKYLEEITKPREINPLPKNVCNGRQTLPSITTRV